MESRCRGRYTDDRGRSHIKMWRRLVMKSVRCPFCLCEFADDPDLAYHLVNDHREKMLDEARNGLDQAVLDIVYLIIDADDTELVSLARSD